MASRSPWLAVGSIVFAFAALLLVQSALFTRPTETISYSEFKALLNAGKLSDLVLGKQTITGTLTGQGVQGLLPPSKIDELKRLGGTTHRFATVRVDDPALVGELEAAHVVFKGRVGSTWLSALLSWVVPSLVFFGLWAFLVRRMNRRAASWRSARARRASTWSTAPA